ncbi:MAG: ankyrin repeat domain-containing protein, partial [Elusimicrobiaceae bacterium]|nr:ankyrin repeat domain-containing protein [Elusimicrobiaceae bacterium]
SGNVEMLRLLCQMHEWDYQQPLALRTAILTNRADMIRLLFQQGVSLNSPMEKLQNQWAFCEAAHRGYTETVKLLLASGMEVDATGYELERTALHHAAREGFGEMVDLLIKAGADVNRPDAVQSTPLHEAVAAGHSDIVQQLVLAGADVNKKNMHAQTPLQLALAAKQTEMADFLRKHGARESER